MLKFVGLALGITGMALAQVPQFEVASVKPDNGPIVMGATGRFGGGPGSSDPGRFRATQVPLRNLIMLAWQLEPSQVRGPKSLDDWFTIAAVIPAGTTKDQYQQMLQNLIVERFHMVSHRETIEVPGYDLVVAPGGSKLKPAGGDDANPGEPEGQDIFTALQTQLGLKLVKSKNVPVELFVVDQVNKVPTEN